MICLDLRSTPKLMRLIKWIRTVALGLVWAETCYLPSNRYATGTQETTTDDVRDGAVNNSRKKKKTKTRWQRIFFKIYLNLPWPQNGAWRPQRKSIFLSPLLTLFHLRLELFSLLFAFWFLSWLSSAPQALFLSSHFLASPAPEFFPPPTTLLISTIPLRVSGVTWHVIQYIFPRFEDTISRKLLNPISLYCAPCLFMCAFLVGSS